MKSRIIVLIVLVNLIYFQIGLLYSILSALIPEIISGYNLSYGVAATLPFAFYIAFAFFCIPAGLANEKFTYKSVLLFSFTLALIGALLFGIFPTYGASITSLFIIGGALAIVQVTIVPLLRDICGAENLAFHASLTQLFYGIGAFSSPHIYSYLTTYLQDKTNTKSFVFSHLLELIPANFEWVSAYWLFSLILLTIIIVIVVVKFPKKDKIKNEEIANRSVYLKLLRNKYVILYFIALAAYASCEQGIAVWMSKFFQDIHGFDPLITGASILSWYWILISGGCIVGMLLLKVFDSRKVLGSLAVLAMVSASLGIYKSAGISKIAFPAVGVFLSVMWPIIISLALNSFKKHHEALTGFLYMATVGGAFGPLIMGSLSDAIGIRLSMNYIFLPLIFILGVSFWAKPLVQNKTI
ncbi:MFS transporter [Flagellimonas pacifica]|uniref:Fucose permease n=1 Tax=Flagellimonas pacifica TaxID=1247520 RepID=A0A285MX51_9FLAO|nr:MFS transporter [Allomuricauda parva]SNZ01755.1 Fucose permease [Allomuricauda parva]